MPILTNTQPGVPSVRSGLEGNQAFAGLVADADMPFGIVVSIKAGSTRLVAGGTSPVGIAERPLPDLNGKALANKPLSYIGAGNSIIALAEVSISAGDKLYYRTAVDGAKTQLGAVANAAGVGLVALNAVATDNSYVVNGITAVPVYLT